MGDVNLRATYHNRLKAHLKTVRDHSTSALDYESAKEILIRAQEVWAKYEEVQSRLIQTAADQAALELQQQAGDVVEETFYQLRRRLRPLIESLTPAATSTPPPGTPVPNIRLPTIDLPCFDGTIADWTSFKDLFAAAVGGNVHLGSAQKLQYLKSALAGEPASLIRSLTVTDSNYGAAWKMLNDRYENEREIVHALINKMLSLKDIKYESATELQRLVDKFQEITRALEVLKRPVDKWDDLLVVIVLNKLDATTRREWAIRQTGTACPTLKELTDFLSSHIRGLQAVGTNGQASTDKREKRPVKVHMVATERSLCVICSGGHAHYKCQELRRRSVMDRKKLVGQHNLCFNCLGSGHMLKSCSWKGTCMKCGKRHHSLLHSDSISKSNNGKMEDDGNRSKGKPAGSEENTTIHLVNVDTRVLLMTAVVYARDKYNSLQPVRVFIDGGAQTEFISENCVQRLGLRRHHTDIRVNGFCGTKVGKARGVVQVQLQSRYSSENELGCNMLIMPTLGGDMPSFKCKEKGWEHLRGLELADPCWHKPGPVDMVLGSQYLHKVLLTDRRENKDPEAPVAWESVFGWVIFGKCNADKGEVSANHVTIDTTDELLRRFWEIEELPNKRILTEAEEKCEKHFVQNVARDGFGKFVVGVPFTEKIQELGRTRDAAVKRLFQVERKLQRNPKVQQQYQEFMNEYERLGHMVKVPESEQKEQVGLTAHLPHHGVVNESSTTTKLRVVFDGSAKSSSGISLNETMLVGATVQDELYNLLLRFRLFPVAVKADIAKMFRQFRLREQDANFHRIVWRNNPSEPICDYKMQTVTYGTACAPFLATRCLNQLAVDVSQSHPVASQVLLENTYVDDILSGESSKERAISLVHELIDAVSTAGLELRKWTSSDPDVLSVIPEEHRDTDPFSFDDDHTIKALGVQWHPSTDMFKFKGVEFKYNEGITKRQLLADASRVFDPLGLISCVSLRAKMQFQDVWKSGCEWDGEIPEHIEEQFVDYKTDLQKLTELNIPRRITINNASEYQWHGFSDSSEKGFGCVLYLRCFNEDGETSVNFITSKTRVAPVKLVSLPRLELEAALMLAKLVKRVKECLQIDGDIYLWSDSTITLTWIAGSPHRWKTYVGNRVSKIQNLTDIKCWRHVPGVDNPADWASRGASAEQLITSDFWWKGPAWLSKPGIPVFPFNEKIDGDMEEKAVKVTVNNANIDDDLRQRFSSLLRLKRVTAYVLRFLRRVKLPMNCRNTGPLLVSELHESMVVWIKFVQHQHFSDEIASLQKKEKVNTNSKLKNVIPFLDNQGVLRVTGRLQHASVPESHKHQVILPADDHFTTLLIRHVHLQLLHGGFQVTWAKLQEEFWIIRGRDKVRHLVRTCVLCKRFRAKAGEQMMGNLPVSRVTPSRPFLHTGVDYAGPFYLKNPIGRVPKTYKGYMCLFVCMVTKAVHLEPVSSLTTEGFLEALRRFVSRRGLCAHLYSDQGSNFVGAERELKKHLESMQSTNAIADDLTARGIQWHFNPPLAPHHGGIWEAGVKSAKYHIRRVVGNNNLTYEQFHTVLCQVEAVMNSRPLYAMSSEPEDFRALTPGHFLIGEPMTAVPAANVENIPVNRLSQFQRQQQRVQHFWRRWSSEYLNTLQQRNKWIRRKENASVGDLVLLVEETSPGTWKMGRIVEVHPGDDGLVRAVTVKTVSGLVKRSIVKLIPLLNSD